MLFYISFLHIIQIFGKLTMLLLAYPSLFLKCIQKTSLYSIWRRYRILAHTTEYYNYWWNFTLSMKWKEKEGSVLYHTASHVRQEWQNWNSASADGSFTYRLKVMYIRERLILSIFWLGNNVKNSNLKSKAFNILIQNNSNLRLLMIYC